MHPQPLPNLGSGVSNTVLMPSFSKPIRNQAWNKWKALTEVQSFTYAIIAMTPTYLPSRLKEAAPHRLLMLI